jgi:glycosyltransferase involved in cell wall biosynthesis
VAGRRNLIAGQIGKRFCSPEIQDVKPSEEQKSGSGTCTAEQLLLKGKRVVAVVFSGYPSDPRPRRAAEALVKEGAAVEVICLKETDEEPRHELFNGVRITRVPLKRRRGGKLSYLLQYGWFILLSGLILAVRTGQRRYDLVHVHNMPDILVFSALIPKLAGAKILLDLHDPMPELMMTIFGFQEHSGPVRLLRELEKWSLHFADAVVTANEAFRKLFSARSCSSGKITVIMNSPDEAIFQCRRPASRDISNGSSQPFVIMYHGSLVERHGLDLAVLALRELRKTVPGAELRIYGRKTAYQETVMASAQQIGLGDSVRYFGPKSLEQVAEAIGQCDVGIIPNRRSVFTELNMPTRIFEYLSQGKPVIAPRTPGILDYFGPEELILFELGDTDDLAKKIEYVFMHRTEMVNLVERGQEVYRAHQWSGERRRFASLVAGLMKIPGSSMAPLAIEESLL